MSGVASGYTLVLADEAHDGAPRTDYIVTDGGVLFATADHGATWRCYGLVDPELFLARPRVRRCLGAARRGRRAGRDPQVPRRLTRPLRAPEDDAAQRRQIPAPSSNRSSSSRIACVSLTACSRLPLRSGWISSSSFSISTMRATRHLMASATGSGRCR